MIKEVDINEVVSNKNICFIDVRSPMEYSVDSIPGAINIPILNDEEREQIGYIYKQIDVNKAKELGLQYASAKLVDFYSKVRELKESNKDVALFCYRGGMRSNSIAGVLDTMGLEVYLIKGGYKSYRRYVIEELNTYSDKFKYIVIHGLTGVGKTRILNMLKDKNKPVLDLETLARNSGSVFGKIAYNGKSRSQKAFESQLLSVFKSIEGKYIFIESESKRIGNVVLPDFLYSEMNNGFHILVETTLKNRVNNIIDDYITPFTNNIDDIKNAIKMLEGKLGKSTIVNLLDRTDAGNFKFVISELMTKYYDPLYQYSIDKVVNYDKIIEYERIDEAVNELLDFYHNHL